MTTPAGDRRVLRDPEMEGMFIDDIVLVARGVFQAIIDDARLFGRDWGFRLADVKAPVRGGTATTTTSCHCGRPSGCRSPA